MGFVKVNFDSCFLVAKGLLKAWLLTKALCSFKLPVLGDSAIVMLWETNKQRGLWKLDIC